MDQMDYEILLTLEKGINPASRPFKEAANHLKTTEQEVVSRLRRLLEGGVIRKFGASINQRKIGVTANAMVVWKVPREHVQEVARIMSSFREVTHCYERKVVPGKWEHNLYTVIHACRRKTVHGIVKRLSEATGIKDYLVLFSSRELKKSSIPAMTMLHASRGVHDRKAIQTFAR